jgi:hypothetical protein
MERFSLTATPRRQIRKRLSKEYVMAEANGVTEINGIKQQIDRLESQTGFFFPDQDKIRACNLLKTKLANLFKELEEIAK